MPTYDAYIHGAWTKITLPEISGGPIIPPPGSGAHPEHPIVLPPPGGGSPPSIWGGANEPFPTPPIVIPPGFIDGIHPEHPIVIPPLNPPPHPAHPIVIPPEVLPPGDAHPEHPIVIPPPPIMYPPIPTHPIVLPPDGPPTPDPKWEVKAYWTPEGGWAVALVPTDEATVPTPSGGS